MTNNQAILYWEMRCQKAKQYSDEHWDAEERHEHDRYIAAIEIAIKAMRSMRNGKWLDNKHTDTAICSECGRCFTDETPHCPHCGANMYGEQTEE